MNNGGERSDDQFAAKESIPTIVGRRTDGDDGQLFMIRFRWALFIRRFAISFEK